MFALSSVRPLVAGAFAVGSFSGVRVEAAASGGVALLFFFRSASAGEAFVSWLAERAGVSASCGGGPLGAVSLFSWVVVLPLSGVAVPAAPLWVPLFRGGSPSGLAGAVVRSLRLPA